MSSKKIKLIIYAVVILIAIILVASYFINKKLRDYDIEEIIEKNYYLLYKDGKIGVINTKGEVLIDPIYENIQIPNPLKPVFICLSDYNNQEDYYENKIIKNDKNENIFTEYDEVSSIKVKDIIGEIPYEKSVLRYKKNNKYGLLSFEGKEITKAKYDEIESLPYKEGELLVKKDGKYGVINPKGVQMIKISYDEIVGDGYYDNNYKNAGYIVGIKDNNTYRYSYIRNDGKVLLKSEYNDISRIKEIDGNEKIYIVVTQNGKKGLYMNNKQIIRCEYQNLEYDEESKLLIASQNNRYGVLNLYGEKIVPVQNKEVSIKGVHIIAKNDANITEYDFNGVQIKNNKYKAVLPTDDEEFYITVDQDNNYGLINTRGVEVIENKYAYLEYLIGKYFAVYNEENKIGIIQNNGKMIIDIKYDVIQRIKNSNIIQAIQLTDKKIELYSEDIEQLATRENAKIYVYDNYIKLINKDSIEYFSKDGKKVSSNEILSDNVLFATVQNGLWGFEDKYDNIKVEPQYENVTEFNKYGFAGIKKDGKWGVIDNDGNIIVEPIYEIEQINIEPEFLGKFYKINYNGEMFYTSDL